MNYALTKEKYYNESLKRVEKIEKELIEELKKIKISYTDENTCQLIDEERFYPEFQSVRNEIESLEKPNERIEEIISQAKNDIIQEINTVNYGKGDLNGVIIDDSGEQFTPNIVEGVHNFENEEKEIQIKMINKCEELKEKVDVIKPGNNVKLGYYFKNRVTYNFSRFSNEQRLLLTKYKKPYIIGPSNYLYSDYYGKNTIWSYDDFKMEIHVIPHSHQDLGWLQTYMGYSRSKLFS